VPAESIGVRRCSTPRISPDAERRKFCRPLLSWADQITLKLQRECFSWTEDTRSTQAVWRVPSLDNSVPVQKLLAQSGYPVAPTRAEELVQFTVEHFRGTVGIIFLNVIRAVVLPGTRPRSRFWGLRYLKGDMYPFILDCGMVAR
jgi:hypothetical protein